MATEIPHPPKTPSPGPAWRAAEAYGCDMDLLAEDKDFAGILDSETFRAFVEKTRGKTGTTDRTDGTNQGETRWP